MGYVPAVRQGHGDDNAGGDDKDVHPSRTISQSQPGEGILYPVYVCADGQHGLPQIQKAVEQSVRLLHQGSFWFHVSETEEHGAVDLRQRVSAAHGHGVGQFGLQFVHIGLNSCLAAAVDHGDEGTGDQHGVRA